MNARTSESDEYETPPWLFAALNTEFYFDFDAAAQESNALCEGWSSNMHADGGRPGYGYAHTIFCNPPYSNIDPFVALALAAETRKWVLLLPARTGTTWFRDLRYAERQGIAELRFYRKRIRFLIDGKEPLNPKTSKPSGPRFESVLAVIR